MAKRSVAVRQKKREKLEKLWRSKRKCLKEAGDYEGLNKLPKNSSAVRLVNRCFITGRSRGYMRKFGISRTKFRELASEGKIPGVKKASW